jgi:hypothetical protein
VTGGSQGALLVSPFNAKWRFSAQAGSVEGSKFCLFSVAFPAQCVSSISLRFHYRRHAFCFLPLAAILESQFWEFLLHSRVNRNNDNVCYISGYLEERILNIITTKKC